jgi:uncharacterized membrane protein YgcG
MINKKNIPLYIALAVPVLMILLVAAFIYLPGIGQKPKYNFLYMTGGNSYYAYGSQQYVVSNGHLVQNPKPYNQYDPTTQPGYVQPDSLKPHFYVYDVSANTATEVTFDQAANNYALNSNNQSPDGYSLQQGNYSGGSFLFGGGGGSDYSSWFLNGHNRSRKLNLQLTGAGYDNFQFLGWIK